MLGRDSVPLGTSVPQPAINAERPVWLPDSAGYFASCFECLGLGGLKAFGVVNSVDDCHEHGFTVHTSE